MRVMGEQCSVAPSWYGITVESNFVYSSNIWPQGNVFALPGHVAAPCSSQGGTNSVAGQVRGCQHATLTRSALTNDLVNSCEVSASSLPFQGTDRMKNEDRLLCLVLHES